jgi:hypothetical protein
MHDESARPRRRPIETDSGTTNISTINGMPSVGVTASGGSR